MRCKDYLRSKEWSMGNGQCPECNGLDPDHYGTGGWIRKSEFGHTTNCPLGLSLKEIGLEVLFQGEFNPKIEYENYINEDGVFGIRPKTEEGCPRLRKFNRQLRADLLYNFYEEADDL